MCVSLLSADLALLVLPSEYSYAQETVNVLRKRGATITAVGQSPIPSVYARQKQHGSIIAVGQSPITSVQAKQKQRGFLMCLIVRDNNPILTEWLAYHYHVLPLRQLIVTEDPKACKSAKAHLDDWQDLIDITVVPACVQRLRVRERFFFII